MTAPAKLEVVELRAGQVWHSTEGLCRQPERHITAVTRWPTRGLCVDYAGWPGRIRVSGRSFRAWIRRHRATLATEEGAA